MVVLVSVVVVLVSFVAVGLFSSLFVVNSGLLFVVFVFVVLISSCFCLFVVMYPVIDGWFLGLLSGFFFLVVVFFVSFVVFGVVVPDNVVCLSLSFGCCSFITSF